MNLDIVLTQQIKKLDYQSLEELRALVERLLKQHQKDHKSPKTEKPVPNKLLAGLMRIPVPVDDVVFNRAELYEDRI